MRPTKAERLAQQAARAERPSIPKATPTTPVAPSPPRPLAPVPIVEWTHCYDQSWKGLITAESFAHPAKAGRHLLAKIFDHLFEIGAITKNSLIVDPFGGVGTTGIAGAWRGCRVICCELEPKFAALARDNFALHAQNLRDMHLPLPLVVQGDSRQLRTHIKDAVDAVVSSPPYVSGGHHKDVNAAWNTNDGGYQDNTAGHAHFQKDTAGYGETDGQMGQMDEGSIDAVVSSPPYEEIAAGAGGLNTKPPRHAGDTDVGRNPQSISQNADQRYGNAEGQLAMMEKGTVEAIVSSPPYADIAQSGGTEGLKKHGTGLTQGERCFTEYGETDGQLGVLKDKGVDAIVSSPPYAETLLNDDQRQAGKGEKLRWGTNEEYGTSEGQLGVMKEQEGVDAVVSKEGEAGNAVTHGEKSNKSKRVDAIVSSPPFGSGDSASAQSIVDRKDPSAMWVKANVGSAGTEGYGTSAGQLAEMPSTQESDTFWAAARDIVRECYAVLKPGGHAVWIVKAFVRDKQIVDFPADWRKLCEYVGFETLTEVHAMLVKRTEFTDIFGDGRVEKKEKKSFFRRLAESKGSPAIDHEVVLIMRKPL